MAEINNKPAIRFKGYDGEWEQKELGHILDIKSAARVHKNEWTKSGVPFFRSSDVVSAYKGEENTKAYISHKLYEELSNMSGRLRKNDILVTGGGSIGIPYLIKSDEPLYSKDADLLWLLNADKINGYFLYTFFSTLAFKRYVSSITHIGTISHYTIEQAKSTPIKIPGKREQNKIGKFLESIDNLISLSQKKYDKLLTIKKAMLEKMFPKKGADVPEIRFKGFSGAWEEKELGDEIEFIGTGKSIFNKSLKKTENQPYAILGSRSIIGYDTDFDYSGDFILTARVGENAGKLYRYSGRVKISDNTVFIQGESLNFIYYLLLKFDLKSLSFGTGQPLIKASELNRLTLKVSNSKEEKSKIGILFDKLDSLSALFQLELEKLKNIKKACLQKMFV